MRLSHQKVKLVVTASEPGEVWHPEVIKLVAHHATEGVLGTIYCDLFARPDKNLGAAQYTLQTGRQVVLPPPAESSYQNPIVALVRPALSHLCVVNARETVMRWGLPRPSPYNNVTGWSAVPPAVSHLEVGGKQLLFLC